VSQHAVQIGLLMMAACVAAPPSGSESGSPPATPSATAPAGAERRQLLPFAITFEPPLAEPGMLSVSHESGWTSHAVAPPSGVVLQLPEGPASLSLRVGAKQFERTIKVAAANGSDDSSCVWMLPR